MTLKVSAATGTV